MHRHVGCMLEEKLGVAEARWPSSLDLLFGFRSMSRINRQHCWKEVILLERSHSFYDKIWFAGDVNFCPAGEQQVDEYPISPHMAVRRALGFANPPSV